MLIWLEIKATSNCEESNTCIVQNVHDRAKCDDYGDRIKYVRDREVRRVGALSSEVLEEIDIRV